MKQEELKPCPFCGSRDVLVYRMDIRQESGIKGNRDRYNYILCVDCAARGSVTTVKKAIKKWNEAKR